MDRVNAQQARRELDRIVGYKISPILSKKVRPRLSAGRVQSVAVRLIADREREILAFKPVEYWSVTATLTPDTPKNKFDAALIERDGKKLEISKPGGGGSNSFRSRRQRVHGQVSQAKREAAQPGRAVYHQHSAAGSLSQARI